MKMRKYQIAAEYLARLLRRLHAHAILVRPAGVALIDIAHITHCSRDPLLETMRMALHEYLHFVDPSLSEEQIERMVRRGVRRPPL